MFFNLVHNASNNSNFKFNSTIAIILGTGAEHVLDNTKRVKSLCSGLVINIQNSKNINKKPE